MLEKIKILAKKFIANEYYIYLLLIILGFLISFKDISSPLNSGDMDAYARANLGFNSYVKHRLLRLDYEGGPWLPLHQNILGFSILLSKDPQLGPRLISLMLNVLSIPMLFILSKRIFIKSKNSTIIAFVAAFIYLIHPLRLMIATQPLSETISMFLFSLILVLSLSKKINTLAIIILINIAALIRFEFWFMLPLIWLVFYLKNDGSKTNLILKCLACTFSPLYMIVISYLHFGNYFDFFLSKYRTAHYLLSQIAYYNFFLASKGWINIILDQIGVTGLVILIYSLSNIIRNKIVTKINLIILLTPAYFFLLLIVQVYLGTMEWLAPRYTFPILIGLMPPIAYGLVEIIKFFLKQKKTTNFLFITSFILILCFADILGLLKNSENWFQTISKNEKSQVLQLVNYFNTSEMSSKKTIYVSDGDWLWPMFVFLTQKHDIEKISTFTYSSIKTDVFDYAIFRKKAGKNKISCDKVEFENEQFRVCKN